MSFINELKRRNVIKVAAAYVIVGWLIMQAGEVMAPALHLPDWVNSTLAFFLILGFPLALVFAWAFEVTPEGIKLEKNIDRDQSITGVTGRKLDFTIIALLVLALGYFAVDKFIFDPRRDEAQIAKAIQSAQQQPPAISVESQNSIAVLPFVNMSSDAEQEYFSDGLSEELLNLLAKIPQLRVAARTSSFSFKGQNLEIPDIAKRLGVAHVLEGSVRTSGDQIRITAQLIQAADGFHLWSETYDRTLVNVFQIQDEIAGHVVEELTETLLGEQARTTKTDPEAYRLFLEGRFQFNKRSAESMWRAKKLLEQSVAIDPGYAPSWAELAYTVLWLSSSVADESEIGELREQARLAISAALAADPNLPSAYFARGSMRVFVDRDIPGGIEDWQTAYELAPGSAFQIATMGTAERIQGNFSRAADFFRQAILLDPLVAEAHNLLAITYYHQGNFDQARHAFNKTLELSPDFVGTKARLGRALLQLGQADAALELGGQEPATVYRLMILAMAHDALGDREQSERLLQELITDYGNVAAFQVAEVYGYRNQPDKAFQWLETSNLTGDTGVLSSLGNPAFLDLLEDQRWPDYLKSIGLYEAWLEMPAEWGGPQS